MESTQEQKMKVYTRREDWLTIIPVGHRYHKFVSIYSEIALALIDSEHNLYTMVTREHGMDVIGYDEMQIIQSSYSLNI